jgi:hypothetical protein
MTTFRHFLPSPLIRLLPGTAPMARFAAFGNALPENY